MRELLLVSSYGNRDFRMGCRRRARGVEFESAGGGRGAFSVQGGGGLSEGPRALGRRAREASRGTHGW